MANVQGIGGVFIFSHRARELALWYQTYLDIEMELHPDGDKFFKVFTTRDVETSVVRENPVFAIYQTHEPLTHNGFILNLRVANLYTLLDALKEKGVEIEPQILEWAHGKHAWIHDADGNRIELYEEIITGE